MEKSVYLSDYRIQLTDLDKEILEKEKLIAYVERSTWRRIIMGSVFWFFEIALYLLVLCFVVAAFWFDLTNLLKAVIEVEQGTTLEFKISIGELQAANFLIKGALLIVATLILALALILKNNRKNLFKLAEVSHYLSEQVNRDNERRVRILDIIVRTGM